MSQKKPSANYGRGDEKTLLHLNAMLCAVQYLDDLIRLAGDDEITPALIQSHQLPQLENRFGLQELRRHFKRLGQEEPVQEPPKKEMVLCNYDKAMDAFRQILAVKQRADWFTVRVDERIHQADDYYRMIPFGMCFSIIAARLHANYVNAQDLQLTGQAIQMSILPEGSAYGGLQTEQIVVLKGETFISAASSKDILRLGRSCYGCVQEKPYPYGSVEECLRDFIQVGLNCCCYNAEQRALWELGSQLVEDSIKAFQKVFQTHFSLQEPLNLQQAALIIQAQKDSQTVKE